MNRGTEWSLLQLSISFLIWGLLIVAVPDLSSAETEGLCAAVRIEIQQELAFERQAFDARMKIGNPSDALDLTNVGVTVKVRDEDGADVPITSDPQSVTGKFFVRIDSLDGVSNVAGGGTILKQSAAEIHWLIIPAPGASGGSLSGKKYFVGASLSYRLGGELKEVDVAPDYIFVKPQPELALDYFLPTQVQADDTFTPEIEPSEPFTLGVRVLNTGKGAARGVTIESAQPKIVENELDLLIGFQITGSFVDDKLVRPSLLAEFGDIAPGKAKIGRWVMETSLSGRFVNFDARFTHSDEFGGELTSLLSRTSAHFLVKDVIVDLPGRDTVRDFLSDESTVLTVFESSGLDTFVTNQSAESTFSSAGNVGQLSIYNLQTPRTAGMLYVKFTDPFDGLMEIQSVTREDGKAILPENAWLSKEGVGRNKKHYFSLFDTNGGGLYRVEFGPKVQGPVPPVLQFIPDRTRTEGQRISFIVEATDANHTVPQLKIDAKPVGSLFIDRGTGVGIFDWPTLIGQAGKYPVTFRASDGIFTAARTSTITLLPIVDTDKDGVPDDKEQHYFGNLSRDGKGDFDGDGISDKEEIEEGTDPTNAANAPGAPVIISPEINSHTDSSTPLLQVLNAPHDGAPYAFDFELYATPQYTQLVLSQPNVAEGSGSLTGWLVPSSLIENAFYYWRARARSGSVAGEWAYGSFVVDAINSAPVTTQLLQPANAGTVDTHRPELVLVNTTDPDGDDITYGFQLATDINAEKPVRYKYDLPPGVDGFARWQVTPDLAEDADYFVRGLAFDARGGSAYTTWSKFRVNTGDNAPTKATLLTPTNDSELQTLTVQFVAGESVDPEGAVVTHLIDVDTSPSFNSGSGLTSASLLASNGQINFAISGLADNTLYYWRVRSSDGANQTVSNTAQFFVNLANDPPGAPSIRNPGAESWVQILNPRLEIFPAVDQDRDELRYHFEVYGDAALTQLIADTVTAELALQLPTLENHHAYYWRVQAIDAHGLSGPWSTISEFSTNDGGKNDPPLISLMSPSVQIQAQSGTQILISWDDSDPDSNASVSLFANGILIATLPEDPDGEGDQFIWSLAGVSAGDYKIAAVISDGEFTNTAELPFAVSVTPAVIDTDKDGVPDSRDNCPYVANANQKDRGSIGVNSKDGIGDLCQCGDVSGDGRVNTVDSKMILDSLKKKAKVKVKKPLLCDVAPNGKCDKSDAAAIGKSVSNILKAQKSKKFAKTKPYIQAAIKLQKCKLSRP